jgi:tRNA threonylcarbamoyladenosine modification (KEOPS) complex  Pcc1 subunit
MSGTIEVRIELSPSVVSSIVEPMELEASSAPSGGHLNILTPEVGGLVMIMGSDDLSTLRAMLNSYMGLVSVAVKTAR